MSWQRHRTMVEIAVINYGMGNLRSVAKALETAGAQVRLATNPAEVGKADGVVLPGVGAMGDCARQLQAAGFDSFLRTWLQEDRPFLGVCLGLQALFTHSEEGPAQGLDLFSGEVRRFRLDASFRIPHMGWNTVSPVQPQDPFWEGLPPEGAHFYFVHSYHVVPADPDLVWATTGYGAPFVSAIRRGRWYATQFHPEKSQKAGLRLYENFLRLCR